MVVASVASYAKEYVTELKNQNKSVSFHALPNHGHLITPDIWFPLAQDFFTKLFSDNLVK